MELGDVALASNGHRMLERVWSLMVEYTTGTGEAGANNERRKAIKRKS
jgi:hypothetical protein